MVKKWETVRIFISSTFEDMHAERDYLVKQVFPELREWCERRKLRMVDIDLRWGVKEEDTQNKNVVEVCLKCIDDARPFFLCFLGQRRGWVPKEGDVALSTFAPEVFPDLKESIGITSVTELEILHALVSPFHRSSIRKDLAPDSNKPVKYALFYLRDDSYLAQMPKGFPALRGIYTNEGEKDPNKRAEADRELARWVKNEIPALCRKDNRPERHYSAQWNPDSSSPELLLPLACTSSVPANIEQWRRKWSDAGIEVGATNIVDSDQVEKAQEYNTLRSRGRLSNFTCAEQPLSRTILADLQAAIADRYPDHMEVSGTSDLQKELDQQEQFLTMGSEGFIKREGDFDDLNRYIQSDSNQPFVLTALGGMGKSALLARWVNDCRSQLEGQKDETIHFRFIGQSDRSTTVYSLLYMLLRELKEVAGKGAEEIPDDPQKLRQELPKFLEAAGRKGKTILVMDALNQLESGVSDLAWLPYQLPRNIKLIVSFKRGEPAAEELLQRMQGQVQFSEIRPFENLDDRRQLVTSYLDQYLKQLDDVLLKAVIELPGAANPLYLKVVLSELRVFGAFANLGEKIRSDFGETPVSAFRGVLKRLENDPAYSPVNPKQAVPLLFGLMAHARQGLSADELIDLFTQALGMEANAVSQQAAADSVYLYLRQVRPFIAHRDGRYDFFFESFKLAAQEAYVGDTFPERTAEDWHGMLARYFAGEPLEKIVDDVKFLNIHKLSEQAYQQVLGKLWSPLQASLTDLDFIEAKCQAISVYELWFDYRTALDHWPASYDTNTKELLIMVSAIIRDQSHNLSLWPEITKQQLVPQIENWLGQGSDSSGGVFSDERLRKHRRSAGWYASRIVPHLIHKLQSGISIFTNKAFAQEEDEWASMEYYETIYRIRREIKTGQNPKPKPKRSTTSQWLYARNVRPVNTNVVTCRGHLGPVNVVLPLDTQHIISASDDGSVHIWNRETTQQEKILQVCSHEIVDLAILEEGKTALALCKICGPYLLDLEARTCQKMTNISKQIEADAPSNWGNTCFVASRYQPHSRKIVIARGPAFWLVDSDSERISGPYMDDLRNYAAFWHAGHLPDNFAERIAGASFGDIVSVSMPSTGSSLLVGYSFGGMLLWNLDRVKVDGYLPFGWPISHAIFKGGNILMGTYHPETGSPMEISAHLLGNELKAYEHGRIGIIPLASSDKNDMYLGTNWDFNLCLVYPDDSITSRSIIEQAGHHNRIRCASIDPDNCRAYTGGEDSEIRIWNIQQKTTTINQDIHWDYCKILEHPSQLILLSKKNGDNTNLYHIVRHVALENTKISHDLVVFRKLGGSFDLTQDGSVVASPSEKTSQNQGMFDQMVLGAWQATTKLPEETAQGNPMKNVSLWSPKTTQLIKEIKFSKKTGGIRQFCISPEGSRIVCLLNNNSISIQGTYEEYENIINNVKMDTICIIPSIGDGITLLGIAGAEVTLFNLQDNSILKKWQISSGISISAASAFYDGIHILLGDLNGSLTIWNAKTGDPEAAWKGHQGKIIDCRVSGTNAYAISSGEDRLNCIWDLSNQQLLGKAPSDFPATCCDLTEDGRFAACIDVNGILYIWELVSGKPTFHFTK